MCCFVGTYVFVGVVFSALLVNKHKKQHQQSTPTNKQRNYIREATATTPMNKQLTYVLDLQGGEMYSWGYNYFGQCGTGNHTTVAEPHFIANLKNVTNIHAGDSHSVVIDKSMFTLHNTTTQHNQPTTQTINQPQKLQIALLNNTK